MIEPNARIYTEGDWIITEYLSSDGRIIDTERRRTVASMEHHRFVKALWIMAAAILSMGLVAIVKAEPLTPTIAIDLDEDNDSWVVRPIRVLWPFPFSWPLIWPISIDAGSEGNQGG